MPIYQSLPPEPPPLSFIYSNTTTPADMETLKKDILILTAYLNSLITYLATYQPTIEVP